MTATTVKSDNITNIETSPIVALDRKKGRIKTIIDKDDIATTSIDEAADTMLFCPVPSNAVILDVLVRSDDLDSHACPTLAVDVGLYYSAIGGTQKKDGRTSGDVISAACLGAAATALQGANVSWTSVANVAAGAPDSEAWALAGLSADPGGIFYVGLSVETAAATAAAGDVDVRVDYI